MIVLTGAPFAPKERNAEKGISNVKSKKVKIKIIDNFFINISIHKISYFVECFFRARFFSVKNGQKKGFGKVR